MSISVECSECGKRYTVPDHFAGKSGRCKACGKVFRIAAPPPSPEVDFDALDGLARAPGQAVKETIVPAPAVSRAAPQQRSAPRRPRSPANHLPWAGVMLASVGVLLLGGALAVVYLFINQEPLIYNFVAAGRMTIILNGEQYRPYQPLLVTVLSMALGGGCIVLGRLYLGQCASDLPRRVLRGLGLVMTAGWVICFIYMLIRQGIVITTPAVLNLPEHRYMNWPVLSPLLPLAGALAAAMLVSVQRAASTLSDTLVRAAPWAAGAALGLGAALVVFAYQSSQVRPMLRQLESTRLQMQIGR